MNKLEELKSNVEALFHAVNQDKKFFAPIYNFVEKLNTILTIGISDVKKDEIKFLAQKIESFFSEYRPTGDGFYMPPQATSANDGTVKDIYRLSNELVILPDGEFTALKPPTFKRNEDIPILKISKKIFLVHGQDEHIKEATARFLEKLELSPIILHEQPSKGRTIIEKFTDYSDVGFAVVLLTADDIGGKSGMKYEDLSPRARQNVIIELGYFLGKIGRQKVCALYQQGVEIPSDYAGVIFIKLDEGNAWRMELAREIKAAGIDVDMNKAI